MARVFVDTNVLFPFSVMDLCARLRLDTLDMAEAPGAYQGPGRLQ